MGAGGGLKTDMFDNLLSYVLFFNKLDTAQCGALSSAKISTDHCTLLATV